MANAFDPITQSDELTTEIEAAFLDLRAKFDRLAWLKDKIAADLEAMRAEADQIDTYTEEQAAAVYQIKPAHLGKLRRQFDLEHCCFGNIIIYTRPQLAGIAEVLTNGKRKAEGGRQKAVIKRAA